MRNLLFFFASSGLILVYLLNSLSGITSWVWLIILGEWQLVILSIFSIFGFSFGFGIVVYILYFILIKPASKLAEKGNNFLATFFGFILSFIIIAIATYWTLFVYSFVYTIGVSTNYSLIPYMLLAYSTSLAPFTYYAKKELSSGANSSEASIVTSFFLSVGGAILLALYLFSDYSFINIHLIFIGIMFLGWIAMMAVAFDSTKKESFKSALLNKDMNNENYQILQDEVYSKCLLQSMLKVTIADGKIDNNEIDLIVKYFKTVFQTEVNDLAIRSLANEMKFRGDNYDNIFSYSGIEDILTTDMKKDIVKAGYLASVSDGEMSDEEASVLEDISRSIKISKEDINIAIDEINQSFKK